MTCLPYSQINGFTKSLLERFWSFRHQKNLLKDKLIATILTGCAPEALAVEMTVIENMDLIGQITVPGSVVCAFCVKGDDFKNSAFKEDRIDTGTKASEYKYPRVEDQKKSLGNSFAN